MKKITALLLVLALCFSSMAVTAFAADDLTFTVSSETAAKGETVELTVRIDNNPGVAGLQLSVVYDADYLEKVEFSGTGMNGGTWVIGNNLIWLGSGSDSTYEGQMLTLKFKVKEDAPAGTTNVTLTAKVSNQAEQAVPFTVVGGTVTITVPAHDHTYGEWTVTKEATCTETGSKTRTCTVADCGVTETEVIPANGHSYEAVVTDPTCTEQGYTTHTCTVCGDSYVDSYTDTVEHNYDNWLTTEHRYCTDPIKQTRTCVDCGATETRELPGYEHSMYIKPNGAPTCTEPGYEIWYCMECGHTEGREVPATGHTYGEWTVTKEATCTEDGEETSTCTVCGETETRVIPAAHTPGEWTVTKEATCTEDGEETSTCTVCGETETRVIPATGHDYEAVVTDPTETEKGYTTYTCTVCGDSYVDDYVDPIPAVTEPAETEPAETEPVEGGSKGPQTGDPANGMWLALMVMSLVGITVLMISNKKRLFN